MAYFPSGFWPRIITRLLADSTFYDKVTSLYKLPASLLSNEAFLSSAEARPTWRCWQTGVSLNYLGACVLRIKQILRDDTTAFCDYRRCRFRVEQADVGIIDVRSTSILEILLPSDAINLALPPNDLLSAASSMTDSLYSSVVLHPQQQVLAAILNLLVDHVDTLLEDWFPDMGLRFAQNSRGMFLITRLVPCVRCLIVQSEIQSRRLESDSAWAMVDTLHDSPGARAHADRNVVVEDDATMTSHASIANSRSMSGISARSSGARQGLYLESDRTSHAEVDDTSLEGVARKLKIQNHF